MTTGTKGLMCCVLAGFCAAVCAGEPPIRLANHESGSTLRYPVPLLRGTLADAKATSVVVVNQSSKRATREMTGLAHKGRFKALTELVPGENKLVLRAGKHELPFSLVYKPQTNSHFARIVYFVGSEGDTAYDTPLKDDPQDYAAKLDTAMKLMQTFAAERLHDAGMGRRTLNLELDADGKVKVHVVKADVPAEQLHKMSGGQLYGYTAGMVRRKLPRGKFKTLVILGCTRWNRETRRPMAHTALGGGSHALFGGGDLFTWPSTLADVQKAFTDARRVDPKTIFSDSVGRHTFWANASTTMGAALHELGHTLALPHSNHPHDIMTRGHDRLNRVFTLVEPPHARRGKPYEFRDDEVAFWAPVSACAIWPNRWLALDDREWKGPANTVFTLNAKDLALDVTCPNGVRGLVFNRPDAFAQYDVDVHKPAPVKVSIPLAWIGKNVRTDAFRLRAFDEEGHIPTLDMRSLLPSPCIRTWRFAKITQPWPDKSKFPPVDDAKLGEIVASARKAKPVTSKDNFVDFLPRFPGSKRANAAGYVLRAIKAPKPTKVRLFAGSDDALRIWLNGKLIKQTLALRGATMDQDRVDAELKAGENTLLVEVANGIGGWGLYLRIEDTRKNELVLDKSGALKPFAASPATERIRQILRGATAEAGKK